MSSWSPLNLQFPDLTVPAGERLLSMQELESYLDDNFNKINQLKILGKFYVVNGAEYSSLDAALNDLWAQGIDNVEILLRSGVSYTLNSLTIASTKQVIIRGLGGRANLTVAGGQWYGTVVLENVNVTFTGDVNSTSGTHTPTVLFRNCSITLNALFNGENGTVVLKDCDHTAWGHYYFRFTTTGFFLSDNVTAAVYSYFVYIYDPTSGSFRCFLFNSRIKKQSTSNNNALIQFHGSLFATNCVFDTSEIPADQPKGYAIMYIIGAGADTKNQYVVLDSCDVIGRGSDKEFGGTFENNGRVHLVRCRFINVGGVNIMQSDNGLSEEAVVAHCYFEYNRSYTSSIRDYAVEVLGCSNALIYGNHVKYTGGTKNNGLFFLRLSNTTVTVFAKNTAEHCGLVDLIHFTFGFSDTVVPFALVANNVSRNCFNKVCHLRPTGHLFVVNNVVYHDLSVTWDNGGSYSWSESDLDLYGAGMVIHVDNPSGTYTRNKTQDDPLRIVVANNMFLRRLANGIMLHISGDSSSFAHRVIVEGNVFVDCDPEKLLSSGEWATYDTYDNKRKGVGILLNALTTGASQKMEPIIIGNRFINTRYGVYHALGKYGYYSNSKYTYPVIGNVYYRVYGALSSFINPDTATDVYWFDNLGMDYTAGSNATVYKTLQRGYSMPTSLLTDEGSYVFPRTKQYDCTGGFAGGHVFGYIPSKINVFENIELPTGLKPTYTTVTIYP